MPVKHLEIWLGFTVTGLSSISDNWSSKLLDWPHAKRWQHVPLKKKMYRHSSSIGLALWRAAALHQPSIPRLHSGTVQWVMGIELTSGKENFTHRLKQEHSSAVTPGYIHCTCTVSSELQCNGYFICLLFFNLGRPKDIYNISTNSRVEQWI